MPDFFLLAAAIELEWSHVAWILAGLGAAISAATKALWSYWTSREEKKRAGWIKVVEDKDTLITQKDAALATANSEGDAALKELRQELMESFLSSLKTKDEMIANLSKKLSEKSDEQAATIQRLMNLTLEKVEGWGDKFRNSQGEFAVVIRELANELQKINNGGESS